MAFTISIHPQHRLIYAKQVGLASREEIIRQRLELSRDPAFDPSFDAIIDLREGDLSALQSSDITSLASTTTLASQSRRVFVADTADKFGLMRMYETRRELSGGDERIRIVATLDQALEWLGLEGVSLDTEW
jgi:hypothetical protein